MSADLIRTKPKEWWKYYGDGVVQSGVTFPDAPKWRQFEGKPIPPRSLSLSERDDERAARYRASEPEIDMVNVALYLRRPLLLTGKPGTGKSSLAYSVARELDLGPVLRWPITSRSTLQQGVYQYDAIARVQDASLKEDKNIGQYVRLGPLGTALLPTERPRVLLIDEIDKSDVDLPNDLLNVLEEGDYLIPELFRMRDKMPTVNVYAADGDDRVPITGGLLRCRAFPFIILTSNGEREFSPAFLRRCLRLHIPEPDPVRLAAIVRSHLTEQWGEATDSPVQRLITDFLNRRSKIDLSTDQLLNAVFMITRETTFGESPEDIEKEKQKLVDSLLASLTSGYTE